MLVGETRRIDCRIHSKPLGRGSSPDRGKEMLLSGLAWAAGRRTNAGALRSLLL